MSWGAGPRASQYLVLAAKARAILAGSTHVMPEHVRAVALPVMRHRIITNFNAEADGVTTDDIVRSLLEEIPVDSSDASTRRDRWTPCFARPVRLGRVIVSEELPVDRTRNRS